MNSRELWSLFTQTGSPAVFLMYREAQRNESPRCGGTEHVPESQGDRPAGVSVPRL